MINIFISHISKMAETEKYLTLLNRDELNIYKRNKSKKYLLSRALMKETLSEKLCVEPSSLNISVKDSGKPYLEGTPLFFSLSHSNDIVMLAVSDDEVGADIEYMKKRDFESLSKYFFNENIKKVVDKKMYFYKLWTRYEAMVKYCGGRIFLQKSCTVDGVLSYYSRPLEDNYYLTVAYKGEKEVSLIEKMPLDRVRDENTCS